MIAAKQYENVKYEGSYNVGPDVCDCLYTKDLVALFCKFWNGEVTWVEKSDDGPHEAINLKLDCTKLKTVFCWRPVSSASYAMSKTIEWTNEWICGNDILACVDRQIEEFVDMCDWIKK